MSTMLPSAEDVATDHLKSSITILLSPLTMVVDVNRVIRMKKFLKPVLWYRVVADGREEGRITLLAECICARWMRGFRF